jgi:hypothetical protein
MELHVDVDPHPVFGDQAALGHPLHLELVGAHVDFVDPVQKGSTSEPPSRITRWPPAPVRISAVSRVDLR